MSSFGAHAYAKCPIGDNRFATIAVRSVLESRMLSSDYYFDDINFPFHRLSPACSAGVERMFSKVGKLHDDLKASQSGETLEHALLAAVNCD